MSERILTTDDLWLPGDVLGGAMLRGWDGPVLFRLRGERVWWRTPCTRDHDGLLLVAASSGFIEPGIDQVRFDCNRREVRRNIVDVLAAGERSHSDFAWTGYTRPRHDLIYVTTAEIRGEITPAVAAGLLWASVLRVDAGMDPVRDVLSPWGNIGSVRSRHASARHDPRAWATIVSDTTYGRLGWRVYRSGHVDIYRRTDASGPETGDGGKAAANAAALSAGYALLEPGALLLPLPDGTGRLETP